MLARLATLLGLSFVACISLAVGVDVRAEPGQKDVVLFCTMSKPVWEKDNKTILDTDKTYTLAPENQTLTIKEIDQAHMGEYVCKNESLTSSQKITVYVQPFVKQFDKSKNMIQDDPLQLECKGYGHPTPTVVWYTKGEPLETDGKRIALKDTLPQADSAQMTNGTVRIEKMGFEDAGDYDCVATNAYGSSNATIKVNVKDKLAALWPFLGICAEVAILCTIIFCYERRRTKKMQEEEDRAAATEEAERLNANNDQKPVDDVRQRK